eukprot:TRINITY_DN17969_c0_g1_i1.p6 TRINITY_DN17969_c0_g1~~TRINITY_DN17969_c0_g1_i1.p6  ORF type:complete len:131 (+),score=3.35 TRINITY_DN17969_c0_g1_i1:436-828(+)
MKRNFSALYIQREKGLKKEQKLLKKIFGFSKRSEILKSDSNKTETQPVLKCVLALQIFVCASKFQITINKILCYPYLEKKGESIVNANHAQNAQHATRALSKFSTRKQYIVNHKHFTSIKTPPKKSYALL